MEHSRSTLQTLQPSLNKADLVGIFHNAKYTRTMSNCIQELHSVTNLIYHASLNGLGWFCRPVLLWLCFDYAQNSTVLFPSVFQVYASLIITLNEAKSAGTLGHFQFHEFHEFHEQTSKAVQRIRPGQRWRSIAAQTFGIRLNHAKSMMVKAWKDMQ